MIWKKVLAALVGIASLSLGIAYGMPWLAAPSCQAKTVAYLHQHPIRGRSYGGDWVAASPADIATRISGAFEVETSYGTPRGMHADVHYHRCTTLPWDISLAPRKTVYLL